jgi:hypothetical protein
MLLREFFEAAGNEVAIIFGRFNPPHKGHKAAWMEAAKSPIWYVGTNKSTVGPKDPLPFEIKVKVMEAIWPKVADHIVAETSWLTMAAMVYEKHKNVTLYCCTDEDWVTKTVIQYNGKEGPHGFYDFPSIEQKVTPRLSSATDLRSAVMLGDRDAFSKAAGVNADADVNGMPFFDLVAKYLLPYADTKSNKSSKASNPKLNPVKQEVGEGIGTQKIKNAYSMDPSAYDTLGPGSEDRSNILIQLKRNIAMHGNHPIEFHDGSTLKLSSQVSQAIMFGIQDLKPVERHSVINQIVQSKKDFINFVKNNEQLAEGWKSKLAGAAMMGLGALGSGGAQAADSGKDGAGVQAPTQTSQQSSMKWLDDPSIPDNLPGKVAGSRFPTKAPVGTKYGSFINDKGEKVNAYVDHELTSRFVPDKDGEWKPQSFPTRAPVGTKYGSFKDTSGKTINKYVDHDLTTKFVPADDDDAKAIPGEPTSAALARMNARPDDQSKADFLGKYMKSALDQGGFNNGKFAKLAKK